MTQKIRYTGEKTEDALTAKMIEVSKQNPTKIITAYGMFGTVDIYIRDRQPRTDTPDSASTYRIRGGFFKNGQLVSPTKTWLKRFNFCPVSR